MMVPVKRDRAEPAAYHAQLSALATTIAAKCTELGVHPRDYFQMLGTLHKAAAFSLILSEEF